MVRANIILVSAVAWLVTGVAASAGVARVDDVLVLNGTTLQFSPIEGLNETTRSDDWQTEYLKTVDLDKINAVYQKVNNDLETLGRKDLSLESFDKRNGATCIACVVTQLAGGYATTRTAAYNLCGVACADFALQSLKSTVSTFWGQAGIGAYAPGNYAYDVWTSYRW